jgi:ATP-dependent Lon protease
MSNTSQKDFLEDRRNERTTIMPMFSDAPMDVCFEPEKMQPGGELPILASRDLVLFPGMTMPLSVGRAKSLKVVSDAEKHKHYIGVVLQRDPEVDDPGKDDLFTVGTLAEVVKILEMNDGTHNVIIQGRRVFHIDELTATTPTLQARVTVLDEQMTGHNKREMKALVSNLKDALKRMMQFVEDLPREIIFAFNNIHDDLYMVNFLCSVFPMTLHRRQVLLEESDVFERAMQLSRVVNTELQFMEMKSDLLKKTQDDLSEQQRQMFLHTQMHTIQEQLGETAEDDVRELVQAADTKHWSESVAETFDKELVKLQRTNEQSPDYSVQYNYLRTMVDLPWGQCTTDNLNLAHAQRVLDREHYGLEKVKERILEHLAVLKLRGDMKSPILCLFGPPGVGKTSLGKSIAKALKREYVRVSLGGLHDEAEIRGHRRTYIGAMPGRIISGILKAGSDNPVFVLDEIDKIGSDFKGDPSSALLEVLDPEQNVNFHDNYLDVDYDLSNVFFIATANSLSSIAPPLLDRMEVIDLSGYIMEEKIEIGSRHLLPRLMKEHGLTDVKFTVPRKTMECIIDRYTRESGVRLLEKRLAKIMRKVAWKVANGEEVSPRLRPEELQDYLGMPDYDPDKYEGNDYAGVVTGLAWTSVGGEILYVESALCKGRGEKLLLTGNLGDVMKESAMLALQYIKSNADALQIPEALFDNYTVHIHCPEGAIPKDGPSAGITMVTSLASTFTQRKVRARMAMTGEITLRGRVLPVGGIKEKILAAKRAGVTDIVLCIDNKKDIEDIKPVYLEGLSFHYVRDISEVLDYALLNEPVKNPKKFVTTPPAPQAPTPTQP